MITAPGAARTVLIADDSAFMRKLIGEMIGEHAGFRVVGFARDGVDTLDQIRRLNPDVVTLDLEMPRLDGLRVLRRIMTESPRAVVVLSAGGPKYGDATLRALELGAVDFVRKPSGPVSLDLPVIRERLMHALDAASAATLAPPAAPVLQRSSPACAALTVVHRAPARYVVVIASSTGGPRALAEIIPLLPDSLGAAVIVAQHLPREFTRALADRLARSSRIAVTEGDDAVELLSGIVYIAPGGIDTRVSGAPGASYLALQPRGSHCGATPSADLLFQSAAEVFGEACTGVVLTGMGRDGATGLRRVRAAGGRAVIQDEASSAIYGMPRAALAEAGADHVSSLSAIASVIVRTVPEERLEWLTA